MEIFHLFCAPWGAFFEIEFEKTILTKKVEGDIMYAKKWDFEDKKAYKINRI